MNSLWPTLRAKSHSSAYTESLLAALNYRELLKRPHVRLLQRALLQYIHPDVVNEIKQNARHGAQQGVQLTRSL
jgi:hypothetical protein